MNRFVTWLSATAALALVASPLAAQTDTAFTYQGSLDENGEVANGRFDFRFALFSTVTGGVPVGAVAINDVPVTDGRFTVQIDFGADPFDNTLRWLEIVVGQTTLSPRQPITRAPYAIQTRGMFIGDDGNVLFHSLSSTEGTVTISSLGGIDMVLDADTNNQGEDQNARIVMMQDGGQVVGRLGYREATNTLEIMQEYNSDLILGTNNVDRLTIDPDGNVGIGTTAPQFPLEVVRDGGTAIGAHNTAISGSAIGVLGRSDSTSGWGVFGWTTASSGETFGVAGSNSSTSGRGVFGEATAATGFTFGVAGRSESTNGRGVFGEATSTSGTTYGVFGESASTDGRGMFGEATATSGFTFGVFGESASTDGRGVFGVASASSGLTVGVWGRSESTGGQGVYGLATASSGLNIGVVGVSNSSSGYDFFAAGAGTDYGSSSSIRWKSDIRNIDQPLEKIARLRGVYFDWDKDHGGHHDVGMIAEEVGKVLPEIVSYEDNGIDAIGMDYSKLTPLLVEAVNALQADNAALQARLAQLEQLVEQLTSPQQREITK
jgi:endosialidase-like protein